MIKKNNFDFFKSEVQRYIDYFGLWEYELRIEPLDLSANNNLAECRCYKMDHDMGGTSLTAIIACDKNWITGKMNDLYEANLNNISRVAFHEVLELLFFQYTEYALARDVIITEREIITENHRIIRRFENTIWKDFLKYNIKESRNMAKKEVKKEVKKVSKKGAKK